MPDQATLEFVGAGILVAGVDEAGRGPLAGPVVTAAVILDPARPVDGLTDSKLLSEPLRESLAAAIRERALAWAVARAEVAEIDRINILHATLAAMVRAVRALEPAPGFVRVDGNQLPRGLPCPGEPVVKGDLTEAAISAASILAKTERDRVMRALAERHPRYGFERHKGYATRGHLQALERHGPCCEHRRSFAPVQRLLCAGELPSAGEASSPER